MALRTPWLWNIVEIPENLNIYFLKRHIPFFRIPFEFIISGAALGMFWLIFSGKWKKKEGLLLLPILFLAVFLCIREPIGRYRLLMLPWFTLLTVCLGAYYCAPRRKTPGVLLLAAVALFYFFRPAEPLRAADFTAWAMVLEKEAGKITPESMTYFTRAFMLKPESSSAISLITRAMRTENRSLAEKSAAHWMKSSGNAPLACYYAALAAFPDHRKMKGFLDLVKPEKLPPRFQFRYYLMQGDTAAKTGSPQAAAHFYKSALRIPEGTPAQRKYAENMIKKLEKEK